MVELENTGSRGIASGTSSQQHFFTQCNAKVESYDWLLLMSAEHKLTISVKQPAFSVKQSSNRMGQSNFITFNKWKKV
jgi:hypothetical protein